MEIRSRRSAVAVAALLALCTAASPVRADSPVERVGVGAAFATPAPGISLFGQFDDRWSGTLSIGFGAEARVNYARGGPRDGYWTVGGGYVANLGVVRAGYGRAWQRGPWRWHLEGTLNLPVYNEGSGGLADAATAAITFLVPIGFGVHYVFGKR